MTADRCRACGAPIRWVRTHAHNRLMPLDDEPDDDGNVTINTDGKAVVHPLGQVTLFRAATYMPHHATCPNWPMA